MKKLYFLAFILLFTACSDSYFVETTVDNYVSNVMYPGDKSSCYEIISLQPCGKSLNRYSSAISSLSHAINTFKEDSVRISVEYQKTKNDTTPKPALYLRRMCVDGNTIKNLSEIKEFYKLLYKNTENFVPYVVTIRSKVDETNQQYIFLLNKQLTQVFNIIKI